MMLLFLALIAFILLFLYLCWWARKRDIEDWNDGKCKEHGLPWVSFDVDSQGGRGYTCRPKNVSLLFPFNPCHIWISYNIENRPKKKKEVKWKMIYKTHVCKPDAIVKIKVEKKEEEKNDKENL